MDSAFAEALRDRYVLERELGRGGMAVVYLVRDVKHQRPVALKVLNPELAISLGPERFQREIRRSYSPSTSLRMTVAGQPATST